MEPLHDNGSADAALTSVDSPQPNSEQHSCDVHQHLSQYTDGAQYSDQLPEAILLIDAESDCVLSANEACARLYAGERDALIDKRVSTLFADQLPGLIAFTQAVLAKGVAWSQDLSLVRADGKPVGVEITGGRIDNGERCVLSLILRERDWIKRQRDRAEASRYHRGGLLHWRRVEQVFSEIERENQLILRAAGEGIYGVNAEGLTTFVNPAAERMLGFRSDELVGRNIHSAIHHSHTDGSEYPGHLCPIYAAFRDGVVHEVDNEVFWHKSGRAFPVEYTSTPIYDNGRLAGAVVVFRDVSDRRTAETDLRNALAEVEALRQRLELENAYLQEEIRAETNYREIVGRSPAINHLIRQIELVSPTDAPVLITGESGTGKELIARAIHGSSQRNQRPLIRVNCAAIPRDLFESEFFGHVRGAFTGAVSNRTGRFELADGGTLFLDEVGEIPLELQSKLLRVLQEQQFERVGDTQTRRVNVRVIAATNRDLKQAVAERGFREDLYFRLNVFPIESVPLRARVEDVPLLAMHFLQRACLKFNKPGLQLTLADTERLQNYDWPGNVRELENVIEREVIVAQSGKLRFDLPRRSAQLAKTHAHAAPVKRARIDENVFTENECRSRDRDNLVQALHRTRGKVFGKEGAADLLGIKPTTLASRIKRWDIDLRDFKKSR